MKSDYIKQYYESLDETSKQQVNAIINSMIQTIETTPNTSIPFNESITDDALSFFDYSINATVSHRRDGDARVGRPDSRWLCWDRNTEVIKCKELIQ
jgi:hypothetical protein